MRGSPLGTPPTLRGPPSSSRQGLSSAHSWGAPACRTFGGRRKENEALLEGLPSPAIGAGAQPGQLERTGQSPRAPSGGAAGQPGRCSLCWGTGTQPQAPQQGGGTGSQPESRAGPGTPHAWPPAQERETRPGDTKYQNHLFTVQRPSRSNVGLAQPRAEGRRAPRGRDGLHLAPGALHPAAVPPSGLRVTWRSAAATRAAPAALPGARPASLPPATPPAVRPGPPPPAPPQARPRGPTWCCFRRPSTASSFFARAAFTLQGSIQWALGQLPPGPVAGRRLRAAGGPGGASIPEELAGGCARPPHPTLLTAGTGPSVRVGDWW